MRETVGSRSRPAIYFDANPNVRPAINEYIEIEGVEPTAVQIKDNNKDEKIVSKTVHWPGR